MKKLYVCNFADERYVCQQQLNTKSAYEKGKADKVLEFHEQDILELKRDFPEHFKIARGGGLWLWKPYIILKALDMIEDSDYLFYCDSGAVFIDDLHLMIPDLEASGHDLMVVEQPLLSHCFTKKECYELMDWHGYSGNQILSGYILMRKSKQSIAYMQEWLDNMKDIRKAYGKKFLPNITEFKDFVSHREDQSVLDILRQKWGLIGYRDPSDFGIFPWQYMRAGGYHRKKYPNSHYPVILLCVRKNNPEAYERNYRKAVRLQKLGLNNELTARIGLLPMYMRHLGRLLVNNIGLGNVLDRLLGKYGK